MNVKAKMEEMREKKQQVAKEISQLRERFAHLEKIERELREGSLARFYEQWDRFFEKGVRAQLDDEEGDFQGWQRFLSIDYSASKDIIEVTCTTLFTFRESNMPVDSEFLLTETTFKKNLIGDVIFIMKFERG